MTNKIIHIYGASGSGITTLGKYISEKLNYTFMDTDDFFCSLVDWGDELIPLSTLVIRLKTATDIRIERLKRREYEHFGSRIEIGGDMFEDHQEFLAWAAAYDHGDINMRSKAKHDEWQKLLQCKQITLDGSIDVKDNFEIIKSYL